MRKVLVLLLFVALLCVAYFAGSRRGRDDGDLSQPPGRAASDRFQPGDTAVVVADRVELRDGEETLARLGKECRLSVEKLSGSWAGGTVQISGKKVFGWVHESYLGVPEVASAARRDAVAAVSVDGAAKPRPTELRTAESPTEPSAEIRTGAPATLAERVADQQAGLETLYTAPSLGMRVIVAREPADLQEIVSLPSIERLVITGEAFNNESLRQLEGLQIPSLSIECPNIGNGGLVPVSKIKNLRELRIWTLGVTDAGLELVATIEELESLDLEGTSVRGEGLVRLQDLPHLAHLALGPTTTDADLAVLKGLTHLTDVDLRACYQLTDGCFDALREVPSLRSVWLPSRLLAMGAERLKQALPGCVVRQ
jgi:hypothetical protein